jgi:hypothetical protein
MLASTYVLQLYTCTDTTIINSCSARGPAGRSPAASAAAAIAEVLAGSPGAPEVPELLLSGRARPGQQQRRHHALHGKAL